MQTARRTFTAGLAVLMLAAGLGLLDGAKTSRPPKKETDAAFVNPIR